MLYRGISAVSIFGCTTNIISLIFGETILESIHFGLKLGYFTVFGVLKFLKSQEIKGIFQGFV